MLQLLKEGNILGHMMRVPPHLRTHPHFQDNYCALVKALHPIRLRKVVCREATPPKTTPTKPPPKPARAHKTRRATIRTGQGLFCVSTSCYTHIHQNFLLSCGYFPTHQFASFFGKLVVGLRGGYTIRPY